MSQVKRGRGRPKSYKPPPGSLAARVAGARRARGLTQAQLAELVGVCPATVKSWEGERSAPCSAHAARLRAVLDV